MSEHTLKSCPYALDGAIYQDCPRDVHGLEGERCLDCAGPSRGRDLVPGRRRAMRMAWYDLRRWLAWRAKGGGERVYEWLWP